MTQSAAGDTLRSRRDECCSFPAYAVHTTVAGLFKAKFITAKTSDKCEDRGAEGAEGGVWRGVPPQKTMGPGERIVSPSHGFLGGAPAAIVYVAVNSL